MNTGGDVGIDDQKWHHICGTYDETDIRLYLDGKLLGVQAITQTLQNAGNDTIFVIGDYHTGGDNTVPTTSTDIQGTFGKVSVWNAALTPTQIRAMMFYDHAALVADNAADTNFDDTLMAKLKGWYQFDEGTGTDVDNVQGTANADLTMSGATWAAAGAFDASDTDCTLVMAKAGTQTIYYKHVEVLNNLTINDGSTTQLWNTEAAGNGLLDVVGNLTVNEKLKSHADKAQSRIRFTAAGTTIAVGSDVRTTALSELYSMELEHSGSTNIPELTTPSLLLDSTATAVATGDLTLTTLLQVNSGTTFNANGNTIAAKVVDVDGGTLNLSNSALNFSVNSSGDQLNLDANSTLTTGNTTITGYSSASKTNTYVPLLGGFEVVGDVKWLDIQADGDLTVIGSVIACNLTGTGANIRQWHHTLDTQQLLDADSGGDDDLRLTKPALDNSHELQTG